MTGFTKLTSVADIVKACPTARRVFDKYGLKGCGGEHGPTEALEFFAAVHNVDIDALVRELNGEMRNPAKKSMSTRSRWEISSTGDSSRRQSSSSFPWALCGAPSISCKLPWAALSCKFAWCPPSRRTRTP